MTQPESLTELEPGPLLRAERERQGISAEQVCTELNIQPNKLRALEAGEYEKMFSVVFTRGYIRSYAKYLGLDSAPLLERFDQIVPVQEQPLPTSESLNVKMGGKRANWLGRIFMVVIILALWMLAYWYFTAESEPATVSNAAVTSEAGAISNDAASNIPASSTETGNTAESVDALATVAEQSEAPSSDDEGNPYALSFEPNSSEQETSPQAQSATELGEGDASTDNSDETLSVSAEPSAEDLQPEPQSESLTDALVLEFTQDCWVRVRDADGQVLLETLQRGGSRVELSGVAPFQIRLGNAEGVSASVNGSSIQVPSSTTGNVVNFVAGGDQ